MSSTKSTPRLKHGDEPTDLLLKVISSSLETLIERGDAAIFIANGSDGQPVVLAVFNRATWENGVLATVGKGQNK